MFKLAEQRRLEEERQQAEELRRQGMVTAGNAFSSVLLLKGEPGATEREGGALLGGPDGKALRAALAKLGYPPEDWCALACWTDDGGFLSPEQLRLAVATLDPATLIACDEAAAALVSDAFVDESPGQAQGLVQAVCGIRLLCLGGFERALGSMRDKQVMWARLKQVPPLGEPY